jgi:hypothetical protein
MKWKINGKEKVGKGIQKRMKGGKKEKKRRKRRGMSGVRFFTPHFVSRKWTLTC